MTECLEEIAAVFARHKQQQVASDDQPSISVRDTPEKPAFASLLSKPNDLTQFSSQLPLPTQRRHHSSSH